MKKLMLMATLLVAGTSVSFAQDSRGNHYNSNDSSYNYDHRYGSHINSGYSRGNHNGGGHRISGNGCNYDHRYGSRMNSGHRSNNRRNHNGNGHRNNYNY